MSNPIDEALEMKKEAGLGFLGKGAKEEVARGAQQALGGALVVGVAAAGMKAVQAIRKSKVYKEMMGSNPDLEEFHREDPRQFNQHFNSLHSLNPQFASDPVIAGTYMRQMSMSPQTAGTTLVQSLESKKKTSPWNIGVGTKGPQVSYDF